MSDGRIFFDTNILLYMYSGTDTRKQDGATELFLRYTRPESLRILISTQVVQEFHAAGSRKLGIPRPDLLAFVTDLLGLPLVIIGPSHIQDAIRKEERYQISFWDGLILAAAEAGGAKTLFSEDLNHGQQYGLVTVCNPFRANPLS
jgi:predicted nucleic acid-binding protein